MHSLSKILIGLGLVSALAGAPTLAHAGGGPNQAAAQKTFRTVKGTDHATLTAKFRNDMADEIEAVGKFKGKANDTPVMHIVATEGEMIQTKIAAVEVSSHDISGPGGRFDFRGPAKSSRFKVLIPVSAHYGLPYKQFASENQYDVWVQDKAGKQVWRQTIDSVAKGKPVAQIQRPDLVTEVELDLPFDKSDEFTVSFTPIDRSASKNGYTSGREVVIRRAQ